jgi:hypothetical protein
VLLHDTHVEITVHEKLEDFDVNFRILQLKNIQTTVINIKQALYFWRGWGLNQNAE